MLASCNRDSGLVQKRQEPWSLSDRDKNLLPLNGVGSLLCSDRFSFLVANGVTPGSVPSGLEPWTSDGCLSSELPLVCGLTQARGDPT